MSVVACIVMMSGWVLCTRFLRFLDFVSDAVYVDLKYDDDLVLCLIVVCEWLGGDLSPMGRCVVCAWCCCYDLCGCVWCISSQVCIVAVLSVCNSDEPNVCCVCGYI